MKYSPPPFLLERFPEFHQRYDLREQFVQILILMEKNCKKLEKQSQSISSKLLLDEIHQFKVWSWKEADRDDYFYQKIIEFDQKTFELCQRPIANLGSSQQ